MGDDRGLGDLKVTCVMSRRSADWSEIIEWDLDDHGAGFMEGYEFVSGPALREGNPSQNSYVFRSASWNEAG